MDTLLVSVYDYDKEEWVSMGSEEIPSDLDDDLARLIGKGLVYEGDWIPGSVELCISRENGHGIRVLLEGQQ